MSLIYAHEQATWYFAIVLHAHLKEFVQSAEAPRGYDKRLTVVQHPELAGKEIVELERQLVRDVLVKP